MGERQSVSDRSRWAPPGWPWELELFTAFFVLVALLLPFYVLSQSESFLSAPSEGSMLIRTLEAWDRGFGYLWILLMVGLYFIHIVLASLTLDFVSTPFTHLLSPTIFAAVTYGRLYTFFKGSSFTPMLVNGTLLEIAIWIIAVQLITWALCKLRKTRHLARFKDIPWDISMPPHYDRSYIAELVFKFHPLFYCPRVYRACGEGILIEGWTYVMPIPFYEMLGVAPADRGDLVSSAFYAATSMRLLLRIQLYDRPDPIFISPKHPNLFFRYCQQLLAGRSPAVEAARAARVAELEATTTPYGEPKSDEEEQNPYYNV